MVGIASIGAYIPHYRLNWKEIGAMWGVKTPDGERAVAGYDEDAVTMAVAAAQDCIRGTKGSVGGLYCAGTTSPYREKQNAAIIAGALDLDPECLTADFAHSLRAGSIAVRAAMDAVNGASAGQVLVTASDCRVGAPKGRFEQILGDGAAALMIGSEDLLAALEGSYSVFREFTDLWRTQKDAFVQSAEARFVDEAGYMPLMRKAISELMRRHSLTPGDVSKVVLYAHDGRAHANLAKALGFEKSQIQDPLFTRIGNTGSAASLLTLVAALEEAAPGDRILFASCGDGCDTLLFRVTERISEARTALTMKERLSGAVPVSYGKYLEWRDLIPVEAPSLPERSEPSLSSRWREHKTISSLYGVRCRKCGTPQLHPNGQAVRVCVACQAKDDFEMYKFSDKTGKLFTYSIDHLQPTKNPPGLNGVVDFEGGGRFICELTDYDLACARVGMPVEMTFRKLSQGKGIVNYFWKAKPRHELARQ
jgi:3-hydroxy-3-methylglutaryl CoA synthase